MLVGEKMREKYSRKHVRVNLPLIGGTSSAPGSKSLEDGCVSVVMEE